MQRLSALELNYGVLTTQHADMNHSFVSREKGNKRMRRQNRRSDEMKEGKEMTEGEERDDFSWKEGRGKKKKSAKVAERRAKSGEQRERRRSGWKKERRKEGKEQKQRH